jgi:hypothetical protein
MSLIKLFPGRLLHIRFYSPDQERKIPGNPEIPEEFQDRKSSISDISGFPAGDRDYSLTFLTVYTQ